MSRLTFDALRNANYPRLILVALLILVGLLYYFAPVYGAIPNRSLTLGDNQPSAVTNYQLGMDLPSAQVVGSIKLELCANSPLPGDICTLPTGVELRNAVLTSQTGETGFSIQPSSFANTIILTRNPIPTTASHVKYEFSNLTNPSGPATYFGRIETFPTSNGSGPDNNFGGLAFEISTTLQVSATVPPYLLFCGGIVISGFDCSTASGNYINFGNFSPTATSSAHTEMVAATNASSGYSISVNGPTLTSGNNIISALSAQDVSRPGVSQFGLNLVANTTPAVGANPQGTGLATVTPGYNVADRYKYVSGDTIATRTDSDEFKKFTVSYIVNISASQPVGVYVTTLSYICLANF